MSKQKIYTVMILVLILGFVLGYEYKAYEVGQSNKADMEYVKSLGL